MQWLEADLRNARNPRVLVASVSCWGLSDSASVAVHVIQRLVDGLQDHIDVSAIRGLPDAYRRMLAAEKLRPLERLLGADRELEVLRRLDCLPQLLVTINTRVVLFIEDADRAPGAGYDPTQLERLLWLLKGISCVTFVLAISKGSVVDISKLCDHIEVLPALNAERVAQTISDLRTHWQRDYTFITPTERSRRSDPLQLGADTGLAAYLRASSGRSTPSEAIAQL